MAIRIGANPIGWSNDDLTEIGGDTPLETCLAEAREAGVEGVELATGFPALAVPRGGTDGSNELLSPAVIARRETTKRSSRQVRAQP